MFAVFRKTVLVSLVVFTVLTTGAWQSNPVVLAQSTGTVETPLFPGLTWSSLGSSTQNIRINMNGDALSVSGERFEAQERYLAGFSLPEDVANYYSNAELAKSGWVSYDAFDEADGVHYVFYHESGVYLSVEFLKCSDAPAYICVAVWKSEQIKSAAFAPAQTAEANNSAEATSSTFGKTSPSDGATGVSSSSATLKWESYSSAEKYAYCVQAGSACEVGSADWTSTYNTSVTLNLSANKTYYWQVRALTCGSCSPKTWVYANNDDAWTFQTQTSKIVIVGNAGVAGAALNYVDGIAKKVTADDTGAYSITVPYNWTGTVTPSKSGYLFTPTSASFTNLTVSQTIQNFTATVAYTISGNAGIAGATLSYTDGTAKTVVADASGNYSIVVPTGWSGTITPSKTSYAFTPASRTYTNVTANQTAQGYTATFVTYTITGNVGAAGAGATLTYDNGGPQFVLSTAGGTYTITVPMGWSGTVKPYEIGYSFTPASKTYSNVQSNQANQDYTANPCASCADKDTVGVFRPSNGLLYLKNLNITGFADVSINYGLAGDYPVVGDWDGNGTATIGIYRSGTFYLRNSNTLGFADLVFAFGQAGDQPIAGDWDGDGIDTIGVYRPSTGEFLLRNTNDAGVADLSFFLGNVGDVGIAGDWTNKGYDTVGVFRPSNGIIFLKNTNTTGIADIALNYGIPGDRPVVGDWDNNGTDTIGVYRNATFYLRNSNTVGFADLVFALGIPGDMPIAGNWDALP